MRKALILYKDEDAGVLTQYDDGTFMFKYNQEWINDTLKPDISLTLPKRMKEHRSKHLFSFFYNMLPEGSNRQIICKYNRIDLNDYFSLLMISANKDAIGAVRVVKSRDQ